MGARRGEENQKTDRIGAPEAGEIRRGRREGLSGRSRRGAEDDRLAHSGPGRLLSSQASPLPCKAPQPHSGHIGPGVIGRRLRGE